MAKLGTTRVPVNPKHARGAVSYSAIIAIFSTVKIVGSVLHARMHSPFFRAGSADAVAAPIQVSAPAVIAITKKCNFTTF